MLEQEVAQGTLDDKNNNWAMLKLIDRFLTIVYIPITIWVVLQIIDLRVWQSGVVNSRFTAADGYEMVQTSNEAHHLLERGIQALQQQNDDLARRIGELERRINND